MSSDKTSRPSRLDEVVAAARRDKERRESGYREQALRLFPWICGRCTREFSRETLSQLTVHHRDHDHDNNPTDGSNWELLCLYCHENEHARALDHAHAGAISLGAPSAAPSGHRPFEGLADRIRNPGDGKP